MVVGYLVFGGKQLSVEGLVRSRLGERLRRLWDSGWGFDALYDALLVRPFMAIARLNKNDVVDLAYALTVAVARGLHRLTALTQTGRLRWYAANMTLGLVLILLLALGVL